MWADAEVRAEIAASLKKAGLLSNLELRYRTKAGRIGVLLTSGELLSIGGEQVMLSMLVDISDRTRAEAEMQSSRSFLGSIIEQSPNPTWISDDKGTLVRINKACCDMLRRLIGEDVEMTTIAAPRPAMVKADPGQIEQVLVNLAVNARDAMPEGGKLTIQVSEAELNAAYGEIPAGVVPGQYVMLAVSDTGCGMDGETKRHLFEPFFTTKGEGKGTGLGLSTVYGIVHQSGGNVWVYSEPGKGTAFKVYLPRVGAGLAPRVEEKTSVVRGRGELVLIVEDAPDLRELAKMIVEKLGYRPVATPNGGAALIQVEEEGLRPDLILTDVIMPGMSGRVLVERLRKKLPGLKVIYMSGYTGSTIVDHAGLELNVDFLQKPFSISTLSSKIRSALGKP